VVFYNKVRNVYARYLIYAFCANYKIFYVNFFLFILLALMLIIFKLCVYFIIVFHICWLVFALSSAYYSSLIFKLEKMDVEAGQVLAFLMDLIRT